ncbi:hypothetical protein NQ314_017365 [Rhamnusium bicolor]|uniref:Enkurin domain-containing protein n=1 Tax=Rhamnusium bicolor TaxID=1586634 RepID=A0AAV8WUZ8_9CUCU|nr:hypothetical protein NQ314_017365 [Rhamnusium bicolor]
MSVVLITKHDENIYNITKSITPFQQKPPRFTKRKGKFHHFYKRCVKLHATMGIPEEIPPDPANYLKKHTGKPSYSSCQPLKDDKTLINKPPQDKVPTLKELQELQKEINKPKTSKNFVIHNIKKVSKMKVKDPEPRVVIDRIGTSKPLKGGLEPMFTKLPEFGTKPKYLVRFNKIHQKVNQMKKDTFGTEKPKCRYITKEERDKLLDGLKQNWEELQKQYQGLPILTDTIPKRNRKLKIESDLKQIEKDIVLVERHPYIYVYDDNELS